ncbi:MAG TPA: ABC transporter permease [Verrucomicrobiae bacterium]|nr:ABC transporter permease [Verrucomicrobiae bacterium]
MFQNVGEMVILFWRTLVALPMAWRQREKVFDQFFEIGNASLLMVCILSFFIGGVIALQTGPVLVERGLASAVGGLVGISTCKELAPVMMSILIAGRIGSSMAAEIGSMRVYQEIDALRTMNINPIHYLVLPRMIAIAIALPLLVIFAVLVAWLGGALVAATVNRIDISIPAFFMNLRDVVDIADVVNGVFKSFCFAVVIGIVSCHQGLVTIGGPRGIGRSVTKAVVNSIVLIVLLDYVLTRLLLK